jgi:glycosyltransferase involved in cell wall biosynthesis
MTLIKQIFTYFKTRVPIWINHIRHILVTEGVFALIKKGFKKAHHTILNFSNPHKLHRLQYGEWQKNIEKQYLNEKYMKKLLGNIKKEPKISILLPTWNKSPEMTTRALESIEEQFYDNWEVCISEGSSKYIEETKQVIEDFKDKHPKKVRLDYLDDELRQKINIIENRNNCLQMASGEYIVYMDSDDELAPNCLLELANEINKHPNTAFIYSDFDKVDPEGNRFDPSFWPDWSPHTILSMMYTTHVRCFKTKLVRKLGGMRKGTEGSDDWDLVLRVAEQVEPEQIRHIPKVLYHWRVYSESTSSNTGAKGWAYENQKRVLEDWIERNNQKAEVVPGLYKGSWRVKFDILGDPKVAIIIPFKDQVQYLKKCLPSIKEKTNYKNYEILLVDNRSQEQETFNYLKSLEEDDRIKLLKYDKPYSFGKLNNWAAKQTNADHILMLNNDTEVIEGGWLKAMLEYSQRSEVGTVGAKLYYPNKRIQHAGIVVGMGGAAAHPHRLQWADSNGYNGWLVNVVNFMAVTGACMMIKRELFLNEMKGFDAVFDPAYQDVDLGIRLYEAGYWNVFTPYAKLVHYESVTRLNKKNKAQLQKDEENAEKLRKRWPQYVGINFCGDPFFNPNLSDGHEDMRLRTTWHGDEWGKKMGLVDS